MNSPIYFMSKCRKINRCGEKFFNVLQHLLSFYLSLRGHRENFQNSCPGNFLASVKFLSEFDDIMHLHLEKVEFGKTRYLSTEIQNEFVQLMSDKVEESIIEKVKHGHYISLMVDFIPDMSLQGQMSLIIRYLDVDDYEVKESFLGCL